MVDKKNPEREKGAAPADYMPAIFGWLNMEDQAEQAREISNISRDNERANISKYKYSNLEENDLAKIKSLENKLNKGRSKSINLIAFSEK